MTFLNFLTTPCHYANLNLIHQPIALKKHSAMTKLKDLNKIQIHLKDYLWNICCAIMSIDTVKRFDRIVAILVKLQSKRGTII